MHLERPPQVSFSEFDWFAPRQSQGNPNHRPLWTEYRAWHQVKHIAKEVGMTPTAAWQLLKGNRSTLQRDVPLRTIEGPEFFYTATPLAESLLRKIDRAVGGGGPVAFESEKGVFADSHARQKLRIRTLMDEAAESSLIEGAATTRKDAVEMLRAGRTPKTEGEMMVRNNFEAMQWIKQRLDRQLSVSMLLELQSMLTSGTNPERERGRLREHGEPVKVWAVGTDEQPIHVPPAASLLPQRLTALCTYANTDYEGNEFVHPLIKAAILHFMIGYEHPFVDGNGRTARAVFYWYALRHGYGIFEYLAISEIIRKGPTRYVQAYLDTELDDGDLTYFILYKLDVIEQSLRRLDQQIQAEDEKLKRAERLLRLSADFNLRQRLILEHALRHPVTIYTAKSHSNSNGISLPTARKDLDELVAMKYMIASVRERETTYHASPELPKKLAKVLRA
jgi:Fic family protein